MPTREFFVKTWELKADQVGEPFRMNKWYPRAISVDGMFNGASVMMEGAINKNEDVYHLLSDKHNAFLTIRIPSLRSIEDIAYLIRPRVVGGTPSTSLIVTLVVEG